MIKSIEAYRTRIYQLVFGLLVIAFSTTAVRRTVTSGNTHHLYVVALFTVFVASILWLDKYYWVLGCYLIFLISVPHVKTSGLELGGGTLVCMYFIRAIFRREISSKPDFPFSWTLMPYVAWVAVIFMLNPCGLYIFGSQSIGFRFYSMLAIGLSAMFVLSHMAFSEHQAKVLFWTCMVGALSCLILVSRAADGLVTGDAFSNTLHYEFLQMRFVAMLLLCRFPLAKILTDVRLFLSFAIAWALCVYSGNRTGGMTPPVSAAILVFLRKRERILFSVCASFAFFGLVFLAAGHGSLYQLPTSVQKALSFLPGEWDSKWLNYGFKDSFREEMRRLAMETIKENPWCGRKGFAIQLGEASWVLSRENNEYAGHALTGNWHNVWLGIAADFGIPCSVFFAVFYGCALVYAYRNIRIFRQGTWLETMYMFMFLRLALLLLNSFFSGGHSAKTPEEAFLWFGFCLALINGRRAEVANATMAPPASRKHAKGVST